MRNPMAADVRLDVRPPCAEHGPDAVAVDAREDAQSRAPVPRSMRMSIVSARSSA